VVQSFLANQTTCIRRGIVYPLQYKALGLGVYEFWFGDDKDRAFATQYYPHGEIPL
jgi:hypothetical protein